MRSINSQLEMTVLELQVVLVSSSVELYVVLAKVFSRTSGSLSDSLVELQVVIVIVL